MLLSKGRDMQLYKVDFQTHYQTTVDMGSAAVCAENPDQAIEIVSCVYDIPKSKTLFDVQKIKPAIIEISRKEIEKPQSLAVVGSSTRNQIYWEAPNSKAETKYWKPPNITQYQCKALAIIKATSERHALKMFTDAVRARAMNETLMNRQISAFILDCDSKVDTKRVTGSCS